MFAIALSYFAYVMLKQETQMFQIILVFRTEGFAKKKGQ